MNLQFWIITLSLAGLVNSGEHTGEKTFVWPFILCQEYVHTEENKWIFHNKNNLACLYVKHQNGMDYKDIFLGQNNTNGCRGNEICINNITMPAYLV